MRASPIPRAVRNLTAPHPQRSRSMPQSRSLLVLCFSLVFAAAVHGGREIHNFNLDWRFLKDDLAGAEAPGFDDSRWERVSAPHTYNDRDTFDNWSLPGHRGEQEQWSGRTWYRKTFTAPKEWSGRKVFIEFEAVRQFAEVFLNGHRLGIAKSGFTPFGFDLTPHLRAGAANVLAVRVDNRFQKDPIPPELQPQAATTAATHPNLAELSRKLMEQIPESLEELQAGQIPWNNPHWHPAHGGIYRNVRLIVTDPLHITLPLYSFLQTEGPYAYAKNVAADSADIGVEVPLRNDGREATDGSLRVRIFDAQGAMVQTFAKDVALAAGTSTKAVFAGKLEQPRLWEPGYPHIYRVQIELVWRGQQIDATEIPLGIRHVKWDTGTGLWLNGAHYKLHGWGQKSTNEWPGLGAAQPDWLQAFTLQLMREAGGNFVRWGHVPGGPSQVVAADQLGLVTLQPGVDGEHDTRGGAWALRSATFRDTIIYYRNHPSVLIWEGGNQKISREHAAELRGHMDRYDPHGERAYAHRRADAITAEFMHVGIGTEGGREIAALPVVEGEYNREESPRRVWDDASPPHYGYPEGRGQTYQLTSEQFAVNQVKHYVNKLGAENHAGGANWIFSDSTSGGRVGVEVARTSGEVDGVRLPKEAFYVTQVMFTYEPRAHLIGHWTYPAGTKKTVYAVANTGGEAELFVNGKSVGRAQPENRFLYTFPDVAFAPGEIKVVARDSAGKELASAAKQTAGPAVALKLTPMTGPDGFRADGADVALFDVEAVDAQGRRAPTFQQRVRFELSGPAIWRGGYNSGRIDSVNHADLDLEAGITRVAVRSTREAGAVTLTVRGAHLTPATAAIEAKEFRGAAPAWPKFGLPPAPVRQPAHLAPKLENAVAAPPGQVGRYTKSFNYSGPGAYIAHVETNAQDGRNAYVDADSPFRDLPPTLRGADWTQLVNRDAFYHAVDLMEMAVAAGTTVYIAHDEKLPRPPWIARQGFVATSDAITVLGRKLSLFRREFAAEAGITYGPNTEDSTAKEGGMYLVFVQKTVR
jgi:beta-galactosidase